MAYRTTFVNENSGGTHLERAEEHCNNTMETMEFYSNLECAHSENAWSELIEYFQGNCEDLEAVEILIDRWKNLPHFNEYGLDFSFHYPQNDDIDFDSLYEDIQENSYYRYQLSWGGPSDEIRIYKNGLIEYVFLDWFCGCGFDVSDNEAMRWVKEFFEEIESIDFDRDIEKEYNGIMGGE